MKKEDLLKHYHRGILINNQILNSVRSRHDISEEKKLDMIEKALNEIKHYTQQIKLLS